MKKYIIIAGVNGAGKSTLYYSNECYKNMPRINMDDEVRLIGSWKNKKDVYAAGLIVSKRLRDLLEGDFSFNQETTLCGRSIFSNIKKARQNGFYIEIRFVGLISFGLAQKRVAHRVENGGHGIPDEDIKRRYYESIANIKRLCPEADKVVFYDNSCELRCFAVYEKGILKWESAKLPKWYVDLYIQGNA